MATLLITIPSTPIVSALGAVALAGIYLLLRKRPATQRMRLLTASAVFLLAAMWAFGSMHKRHSFAPSQSIATTATVAMHPQAITMRPDAVAMRWTDAPRAVYGHSIVKGGIHSLGELLNVIATDPLAAQHYKGFDLTRAHFIRLDHNMMAYISYRVDGKGIYWTSKPELIMAGEQVITDGTNYIRVRCGNMISYAPQSPAETVAPTDTDTIVETFTPFSGAPVATATLIPPGNTPDGNTPSSAPPPSGCCSFTPPPIFTVPSLPGTPAPPPGTPTVSVDEFSGREAFYTLFAAILVLFLVGNFRPR